MSPDGVASATTRHEGSNVCRILGPGREVEVAPTPTRSPELRIRNASKRCVMNGQAFGGRIWSMSCSVR
jgi:hypothetical protein